MYIIIALMLFLGFALVGFFYPIFMQGQIQSYVDQVLQETESLNQTSLIGFIFLNNLKASFLSMIFGVFFGVFPIVTVLANGYLIGFVARYAVNSDGIFVLWRILPHGVFEIPALLISIGLGLKLGISFWSKKEKFNHLKKDLVECLRCFIFVIVPLLFLAGIIEGLLIFLFK
jgi:stage II sporulation protein M